MAPFPCRTAGGCSPINGGTYGSLSTPILNPPQSGILACTHRNAPSSGQPNHIRSMMYPALSYDHRLRTGNRPYNPHR
ncbi:MAG: 2-oxo acid dehydrogenase subunit E2 [Akkermansia sp.]